MSKTILGAYCLSFSYGHKRPALDEISIELMQGGIMALLGPNASGKTTLLKALAGLFPRNEFSGIVRYCGLDFFGYPHSERAKRVVYVSQDMRAEFPLTAYDAVMMGRLCYGARLFVHASRADHDAVQSAMERCACWELRSRMIDALSGGERQLVLFARALAQGARVLLLDETLSRMDLHHQAMAGRILRCLSAQGYSTVLVAHDVNLASEWADTCVMMQKGRVVASGPVKEVFGAGHLGGLYPGAEITVAPSPVSGAPKVYFGRR